MTIQTIQEFCKEHNFVQVSKDVRVNTNGYPFVTFIDDNNEAENIYFTKAASKSVEEGDSVPQILKHYQIAHTENAEGEKRVKLASNSERVDLSSIFGKQVESTPKVPVTEG